MVMTGLAIAVVVGASEQDKRQGGSGFEIDMKDVPVPQLAIALIMFIMAIIGAMMFVCCDSAQSRKVFAITTLIGGLSNLVEQQNGGTIVGAIISCYYAYEINRLAEAAKN